MKRMGSPAAYRRKSEGSPRRLYRKGFRTIQWKATDPDNDSLSFDVEFRPVSGTKGNLRGSALWGKKTKGEARSSALWGKPGRLAALLSLLAVLAAPTAASASGQGGALVPDGLLARAQANPDRAFNVIVQAKRGKSSTYVARMVNGVVAEHKGKAKGLDEQRVKNAVAVLTGGTGTCAKVDVVRVKADWTGSEQVSDMQPGLCGTSTRTATKERKVSTVSTADQNRRVEVWLVPKGTKMPDAFKGAKELPAKEMKRLGCPK